MTDINKDYILFGITILVLYLLLKGKVTTEVSSKIIPYGNNNEFDYAVCGVSSDVIKNNLPIRICIDPSTGMEYPVGEYPQGNYGQVIFLTAKDQIARSNLINGVIPV